VRVLVTGAGGMLGGYVVQASTAGGHATLGLSHEELDITDARALADAIEEFRPDAVINAAAYTDVDGAEADEAGAMALNDTAAGLVAAAAARAGAKVVYPSSDYVFDGTQRTPYVESDVTGPVCAYGRSKQAGETSVAISNPRHLIARTSWLFGLGGRNFVETMLRVGREQPEVMVVADQVGCPTYARHLAAAIVALLPSEDYGIHHLASAGRCSWYEFAQEIFDQADVACRVLSATSAEFRRPAPRPAYSALASERRGAIQLPAWRDGLREYLRERERAGVIA
jgi:dTDP-4-dehydrorhamnose reductase